MELTQLEDARTFATRLGEQAVLFMPSFVSAILFLVVGLFLAGWLSRAVGRALGRSIRLDQTMRAPIVAIVKYLIVIMTLVIALGQVGVQMTSLLAILGAAGLAVGLALQGTLTNIAAGIMLLWLRPFRVGDYVETSAFAGTVREIGLFVSHLETYDGLFVFAPNSTLWNVWLRNHSRAAARTLAWSVTISRDISFEEARAALLGGWSTSKNTPLVDRQAHLDQLTADSQVIVFRGDVQEGSIVRAQHETAAKIREALVARFGEAGDPKSIQRLVPADADPSRYMNSGEAPQAHAELVNDRPEAPKQGTTTPPAGATATP